jgi:hypothetical protein
MRVIISLHLGNDPCGWPFVVTIWDILAEQQHEDFFHPESENINNHLGLFLALSGAFRKNRADLLRFAHHQTAKKKKMEVMRRKHNFTKRQPFPKTSMLHR